MTLKNNVDTNAAPGDESDVSVPVSPASVAGPETNEASSEDDAKGLPVAKPDGDESSSTGATGEADEFPALDVCVASMTEAEQRDWEQAKALFQDPANALAAESLDHEMITRQVRGKHFIKKDKQRWKVIATYVENHMMWRAQVDLSSFQTWTMEKFDLFRTKVWPMKLLGIDADNHPVVALALNECDWRTAAKSFSKDQLLLYIAYYQEQLFHRYRTEFRCKYRQKIILNLKGMGMSDFSAAKSLGITKMFQMLDHNYPETIEKFYVVDSPWIMPKVFSFLKPFIAPDTVSKVHIWSKNSRSKFMAAEPRVSAEMLPTFLGGPREGDYLFASPGSLIGDRRRSIRPVSAPRPPVAAVVTEEDAQSAR